MLWACCCKYGPECFYHTLQCLYPTFLHPQTRMPMVLVTLESAMSLSGTSKDRMSTTRIKQPHRELNLYPHSKPQNSSLSLSMSTICSDLWGIKYIFRRLELNESLTRLVQREVRAPGSTKAEKVLISLCQKAAALACWTRRCWISIWPDVRPVPLSQWVDIFEEILLVLDNLDSSQ